MCTKDDYILRSLAKISKKKWEFYVISRVIHKLNDPEIEFVTQQHVKLENGNRVLTDIYFPQFGIHLEVDEAQHISIKQAEADKRRTEDIVARTDHSVRRIKAAYKDEIDGEIKDHTLADVNQETDKFVKYIKNLKQEQKETGEFKCWDFEDRYDPERHIEAGSIAVKDRVLFKLQQHALKCFGYTKGNYRRGVWKCPDDTGDIVWFPWLIERDDWGNELSHNGKEIKQIAKTEKSKAIARHSLNSDQDKGMRIVFARSRDPLGYRLYKYVGTFKVDAEKSCPEEVIFNLVRSQEKIRNQ